MMRDQPVVVAQSVKCPECGAPMTLITKNAKYGPFYGCVMFRQTGCRGTHSAHANGQPMGVPGDRETKAARVRAHAAFDQLWTGGKMSRKKAYQWMQETMHLTKRQAHIGKFDVEQCEALITHIQERFG